jgi:hypothetical protein
VGGNRLARAAAVDRHPVHCHAVRPEVNAHGRGALCTFNESCTYAAGLPAARASCEPMRTKLLSPSLLARHLDVRIQAKGTATLSSSVQHGPGHPHDRPRSILADTPTVTCGDHLVFTPPLCGLRLHTHEDTS